jgi:hypothetical protein
MDNNITIETLVGVDSQGDKIAMDGSKDDRYGNLPEGRRPRIEDVKDKGERVALIQNGVLCMKRVVTQPKLEAIRAEVNRILESRQQPVVTGVSLMPDPDKLAPGKKRKGKHL